MFAGSYGEPILYDVKMVVPYLSFFCEKKLLISNPFADVPFNKKLEYFFSSGVREIRLTNPAIAPPPYNVEDAPLIISTCRRSNGTICNKLNPPENPEYNGNPSFNI